MTPSNKTRLDELYGFWRTLRDAQYMRGMNYREKSDMLRILREEFWPGYTYDEWCSSCVADMVKALYTRYDKWLSEQPPPEPEPTPPDAPIIVAASFPVHEKLELPPDTFYSNEATDKPIELTPPKKNHRRK